MVTYDGSILQVTNSSESDLFWASCGGGGGQFGIITQISFTAFYVPSPTVVHLNFRYDIDQFVPLFEWYQEYATFKAPRDFFTKLIWLPLFGGIALDGEFIGTEEQLRDELKRSGLFQAAGEPACQQVVVYDPIQSILDSALLPVDDPESLIEAPSPSRFEKLRSSIVYDTLDADQLADLLQL